MKLKKVLLALVAMALLCCVSVLGTLAYLKKSTTGVTNTFTAGKDLTEDDPNTEDVEGLKLEEYTVTTNANGSYTLGSTKAATGVSYTLLPGVDMPKKPVVSVSGKTTTPAYLYIEFIDGLDGIDGLTYSIDTANWTLLSGATGPNGGAVYVYKNSTIVTSNVGETTILTNNKITVADDFDIGDVTEAKTLVFYAYLAQASAGTDATAAFNACFSAS